MNTAQKALMLVPGWQNLVRTFALTQQQSSQLCEYSARVLEANELFNITAITELDDFVAYHLEDSLALTYGVDVKKITMLADIGTGGGFPAIPLKIVFPHLHIMLLEVNKKKIEFLNGVITSLGLTQTYVGDMDWRTFLRKTDEPIDLFTARASLHTDELMRMFKLGSPYKQSTLVYWASQEWKINSLEQQFFVKEVSYTVKNRQRRLIFFAKTGN